MTAGETAWRAPSISGLDTLLRRDYERAASIDPECETLLSPIEQHALFRSCAPDGLVHLTPLFEDAWQHLHGWQLDLASNAFADSENTRVFAQWAAAVETQLTNRNALTTAQLAARRFPHLPESGPVHLLGFDVLTSAQQNWIEYAQTAGTTITIDNNQPNPAEPSATVADSVIRQTRSGQASQFSSSIAEQTAAICWARARLEAAPGGQPLPRIAIVVPDLLQQHATVSRLLHSQLEATGARDQVLYNLGGGLPLAQHPLIASAMALLNSINHLSHYTELERLLVDPALPAINTDRRLPKSCTEFMRLQNIPPDICPEPLRVILRTVQGWPDDDTADSQRSTRDWWQSAASVLRNARWHTARNDSEGYQATNALLELLMSQAPESDTLVSWSEAFALLASVTGQTLFAPAGQPAPLQVLGYLEALELEFDHLWITGMSDTAWPTPVVSNPLLPVAELTAAGAPRTTYTAELAFAQSWLGRVTRTPKERHASFVNEEPPEEDSLPNVAGISALLAHWTPATTDLPATAQHWHPTLAHWQHSTDTTPVDLTPTEATPETLYGVPPSPPRLHRANRRLQDQAACPMRGWASHQLGIEDAIAPHTLPNPMERGDVLHDALDRLFGEIPSSAALAELSEADETQLCKQVAQQSIDEKMLRYAKSVRALETERLVTQLGHFLGIERKRDEFFVNARELPAKAIIGPFELRLQLDRVDDTAHGQFVIDYKSSAPSNTTLLDERLSAPQLPLYVLLLMADGNPIGELTFTDPIVTAAAFAQIKPEGSKYVGLRSPDTDLGLKSVDGKNDWTPLLTRWRDQLTLLANEIAEGHATATPTKSACNTCKLHSLCRYHLRYD